MPRYIPGYMYARLAAGAQTLAELIKIKPNPGPGEEIAFTDYEEDLTVDGTTYVARPGIKMQKSQSTMTLAVDNSEAQGVVTTPITTALLYAGAYDGAEFERAVCDYAVIKGYDNMAPIAGQNRIVLMSGYLGRFVITDKGFTVELRSKAQLLQQNVGEVISSSCRVRRLFDERCKAPKSRLGRPNPDPITGQTPPGGGAGPWGYIANGTVDALLIDGLGRVNELMFRAAVVDGYPLGWFRHGTLLWTSGDNNGLEVDVREDLMFGGQRVICLVSPEGHPFQAGWGFTLEAGCDRTHSACVIKFQNAIHFQGDPWIMGDTEFYRLP